MMKISEDWERLTDMDKMYLLEKENKIWEEYQEWVESQRIAAKIEVIMPKVEENANKEHDSKRQDIRK